MFPRLRHKWLALVCLPIAVAAQILALRLDWKADSQSHPKLQSMKIQSGYELQLDDAAGKQNDTILSYHATDTHDHLVTLEMEKASLSKESQALLPLPNLAKLQGKLLYAPDTLGGQLHTGKPCRTAFRVAFFNQSGSREHAVTLYPPGPDEFKQLDRLRTIHLRARSALIVHISANSQNGESGPNCRNRVSIDQWEQAIGKDLELAFLAEPGSEVTLKVSSDPKTEDGFRSGKDELELLNLEALHPARLAVSPLGMNRAEQIRKRAGPPDMALTNLRLAGDFFEVDLSGLVGLPVSDLLGGWKWPLLAFVNVPLVIWFGGALKRRRSPIPMLAPVFPASPHVSGRLRIFLSYSWEDKERVMQIHDLLEAAGAEPWIDREEIRGGADWELSIKRQMHDSQRVVIFLSQASLQKVGYAWAEIRMAARIAEEQPEGTPFIIPVKLDDCALPDLLSRWNSIELYRPDGESRLLDALGLPQANSGTQTANATL
jgi:hypothetical protein